MRKQDLVTMQFEDLWQLYEQLATVLADKLAAEKCELEHRMAKLGAVEIVRAARTGPPLSLSLTDRTSRRKYPKVHPKYRNPQAPSQEWSGRGKTPRWVRAALAEGQRLEDLKIRHAQEHIREERPRGGRPAPAAR